jgi:hypothetical protein
MISRRVCLSTMGLAALSLRAGGARAGTLATPAAHPVLSITGKISSTNVDNSAVFDLSMLEAMPQIAIQTTTPWFTGPVTFEGVPMTALMQAIGSSGTKIVVYSLNDYVSEIPVEDFAKFGPILAIKRDGNYMPVRDKGPLFIVYPYDSSPDLKSQKYYSRSPWQIARIDVK